MKTMAPFSSQAQAQVQPMAADEEVTEIHPHSFLRGGEGIFRFKANEQKLLNNV